MGTDESTPGRGASSGRRLYRPIRFRSDIQLVGRQLGGKGSSLLTVSGLPEVLEEAILFEVRAIALSHSNAPVNDTALVYARQAVHGDLDAVVPYAAVYDAHHILCNGYSFAVNEATHVLTNLLDALEI